MKHTFGKLFVLMLVVAFLAISSASPTSAQAPEPPEIMENGEYPVDLNTIEQSITDRTIITVDGGNGVNATYTWWSSSGTTFVPSSSTITYNYGGDGCVDTGAISDVWRGSINLPNESTIIGMWFNYDNEEVDPIDTSVYVRRYSWTGTYDTILTVTGASTGLGNKTNYSGSAENNVVNNSAYAYVLVWVGRPTQNLCSVNIYYSPPPVYLNALPMINR